MINIKCISVILYWKRVYVTEFLNISENYEGPYTVRS